MDEKRHGNYLQYTFDSYGEFVQFNRERQNSDLNTQIVAYAGYGSDFVGGVQNLEEVITLAEKGMRKEGIAAINGAKLKMSEVARDLDTFKSVPYADVSGAYVNIADYLSGVPECMTDYRIDPTTQSQPTVSLVIACAVLGTVEADAITKRGRTLVALIDAIQSAGKTVELWADMTSNSGWGEPKYTARFSIKLKSASAPLDVATLMYAMTHPSFFRGLGFNTRHTLPYKWQRAMGVGHGYGSTVHEAEYIERDYPEGAIFIPALQDGDDPDAILTSTLRTLGLLKD
ncbi:DUF7192 family protein [Mycobacteroides abscessus]|uniref:DUF7192 family protein n=1 Tax=Mycobacteroides abscessus TaxID=36809 RepID=UPI0009A55D2C|nr:hypothetical protein [Mycobacteroides abscessus]SKT45561.1 Uncharacterised protein [Mycobacteroides abscessus subsp. bolletii]